MTQPPLDSLKTVKRVFVCVGESSGDLHASNLIRNMAKTHPEVKFEGFGGPLMEEAGCRLHADIIHLASMGVGFVAHIFKFIGLVRKVQKLLNDDPPDAFLLIDMPGFNFVLARLAKWYSVPVVYYICPQIWAWAPWRRRKILRLTDLLMVILPFEVEYYEDEDHEVVFVGHPLGDSLIHQPPPEEIAHGLRDEFKISDKEKIIGLFPGSRGHEVETLLPYFKSILSKMSLDGDIHRILISSCREEFTDPINEAFSDFELKVDIVSGEARPLMAACDLALVASGTATLELAYYQKPMLVLYRITNVFYYRMFRWLCTSPYISLVNILGGGEIVPEEIDYRDGSDKQALLAEELLTDSELRRKCLKGLKRLREEVFKPGASQKAADTLGQFLEKCPPAGP